MCSQIIACTAEPYLASVCALSQPNLPCMIFSPSPSERETKEGRNDELGVGLGVCVCRIIVTSKDRPDAAGGLVLFFFLLLFDNLMTVRRRAFFFAGSCLLSDVSESGLEGLSWVSKVCLDGSRREEEEVT